MHVQGFKKKRKEMHVQSFSRLLLLERKDEHARSTSCKSKRHVTRAIRQNKEGPTNSKLWPLIDASSPLRPPTYSSHTHKNKAG